MNSDGETIIEVLGGARVGAILSGRIGVFGEALAGMLRIDGDNALTIEPAGGVIIPIPRQRFLVTAKLGLHTEAEGPFRFTGSMLSVGLTVPLGSTPR